MKLYKVIRYCKTCKKKFFVTSTVSRSYYCEECYAKNIAKIVPKEVAKDVPKTKVVSKKKA